MSKKIEQLLRKYQECNHSKIIDYDKFNEYAIVHHSSSIEGSTLSEVETRLLLDEELTPKGKPLNHSLMTRDHYWALQFVLKEAENKREITPELIQEININVLRTTGTVCNTIFGPVDSSKGEFRKVNVSVGGSYPPNYSKVPKLIEELCEKLNVLFERNNKSEDRLDFSFMAHFHLVSIHPFYDGNGRTSRLLMNFIQKRYDLPLAIVFKEDIEDYFTALEETRKEKDEKIFSDFMRGQYEKFLLQEIKKYEALK